MIPPRLEYAVAFDEAAAHLGGLRAPCLVLATAPAFVDAALSRAEAAPHVVAAGDVAAHVEMRLESGLLPEAVASGTRIMAAVDEAGAGYDRILWATPQPGSWEAVLATLAGKAAPGARLCVLTATVLGDTLGSARRGSNPGEPRALARVLAGALRGHAWRLAGVRPVGSAAGLGWAVAGRLAEQAGRPDLADRAEMAHHLAVESPRTPTYVLLLAERRP
jgi:hypothetical protein